MIENILTIPLTDGQADQLAPLIRQNASQGKNALFLSTVAPDGNEWRWQLITLPRSLGSKILKIIEEQK